MSSKVQALVAAFIPSIFINSKMPKPQSYLSIEKNENLSEIHGLIQRGDRASGPPLISQSMGFAMAKL